jgi:hypothetical protein
VAFYGTIGIGYWMYKYYKSNVARRIARDCWEKDQRRWQQEQRL